MTENLIQAGWRKIANALRLAAEGIEEVAAHQGYRNSPGTISTLDQPNTSQLVRASVHDGSATRWRDDVFGGNAPTSHVWDGTTVSLDYVRGAWVHFMVTLESVNGLAQAVTVAFDQLTFAGNTIQNTGSDVQDHSNRPLQVLAAQYLPQDSTSFFGALLYDEAHQPPPMRADSSSLWSTRPKADGLNPAILQDVLISPSVGVPSSGSQELCVDIWIDDAQTPGLYQGPLVLTDSAGDVITIAVDLNVRAPVMPGQNTTINGVFVPYGVTGERFTGERNPSVPSAEHTAQQDVTDDIYRLMKAHRLDPVGDEPKTPATTLPTSTPDAREADRLLGNIFSAANGYLGPASNTHLPYKWLAAYRSWINYAGMADSEDPANDEDNAAIVAAEVNGFLGWAAANSWTGDAPLYTIDEAQSAAGFALANKFASWSPGQSMSTYGLTTSPTVDDALNDVPNLTHYSFAGHCAPTSLFAQPGDADYGDGSRTIPFHQGNGKKIGYYNGISPAQGSMQQAEVPVALSSNYIMHAIHGLDYHFWWNAAYHRNIDGFSLTGVVPGTYDGDLHADFRATAHTFGSSTAGLDETNYGKRGFRRSLGDGCFCFPRTDIFHPSGVPGIAGQDPATKLKAVRRGIQAQELYYMAAAVDAPRALAALRAFMPVTVFEAGVANDGLPNQERTYTPSPRHQDQFTGDTWRAMEHELMNTIEGI